MFTPMEIAVRFQIIHIFLVILTLYYLTVLPFSHMLPACSLRMFSELSFVLVLVKILNIFLVLISQLIYQIKQLAS